MRIRILIYERYKLETKNELMNGWLINEKYNSGWEI